MSALPAQAGQPSARFRGVDAHALRRAIGSFATGVTVVTSVDAAGQPVGTTANAIASLSLAPPLVLVCFDRRSMTLHALRQHRAFAINVLAAGHHELSTSFARRGAGGAAWEQVSHHRGTTGSPRLHGMLASLECTVERRLPGGDHEIIVGRVLDIETSDNDQQPLLFYRGEYASLPRP